MAKSGFASGFAGFLIGVVTGLGVAAGAMLVIAKSPVPFVDKVDKVTADVDPAAKLAGAVDPNARLNQTAGEEPTGETEVRHPTHSEYPSSNSCSYFLGSGRGFSSED